MVAFNQDTHEVKNLLKPVTFSADEYQKVMRDYVCALCGSHLNAFFAPDRRYFLACPEHGKVLEHTYAHKRNMAKILEGQYFAERELTYKPSGKTPAEIMKELGY